MGLAIAVIGSLANLLVSFALHATARRTHDHAWASWLGQMSIGHAIWGVAQLIPLAPFRLGAELARHLPAALRRTHAIASGGLAVGLGVAIFDLPRVPLLTFALAFVALSALRAAYDALQEERDEQAGVERASHDARAELTAGNARQAITIARSALETAHSLTQRRKLWLTLAWSGIDQRDPFLAHLALQHLPPADIDLHLLAAYLTCCNRSSEAEQLLLEARSLGQRSAETSKLLLELSFARGDRARALALADADAELLSADDRQALAVALGDDWRQAVARSAA